MKRLLIVGVPVLAAAVLLANFATEPATGQIKKGKTRPLTTHQLMHGLVGPNCSALGKGLKGTPNEKTLKSLATNAALLNEAGHILMADGRCPDAVWAGAAKTLRGCSQVVLDKLAKNDIEGAQGAFKAMTKACGACHKKHKK